MRQERQKCSKELDKSGHIEGLIPHWAKDESIGYKMINARAETITEKPAFRGLLPSKRCIVPASGFYEWQATGEKGKQPYYIHADAGEYLPFAGLYDIWKNPEGIEIYSFTIITTQPTANLQSIHNRMPVILEPKAEEVWLNPDGTDPQELIPSLKNSCATCNGLPTSCCVPWSRVHKHSKELVLLPSCTCHSPVSHLERKQRLLGSCAQATRMQ